MRYPDGGGLTVQGRSRRKQVRLQAAEMFAQELDARQVARSLRVSTKSACQWRRAWRAGGRRWPHEGRAAAVQRLRPGRAAARRFGRRLRTAGSRTSGGPWPGSPSWSCACSASRTRCAGSRSCCTAWLHLPGYAHDLNAVEGAWASMKSSLGTTLPPPWANWKPWSAAGSARSSASPT